MRLQMMAQQNPQMAERLKGAVSSVAELDCDIIIDEAPDNLTPQLEQFQALVELKKMDMNGEIPFRAIVEAIPNLKNRQKFLEHMDQASQQQPAPPPELLKMQIDGEVKQQTAAHDAQLAQQKLAVDSELKQQELAAEIELQRAKVSAEIELQREKAAAEMEIKRDVAAATFAERSRAAAQATPA